MARRNRKFYSNSNFPPDSGVVPPTPPSFHKRPLPKSLTALSSPEGKILFREALLSGGMESYFALSEQFITQSEPSYCALSSLAMVLNALNYDPKRIWKGAWRWVSEEMLQCETHSMCDHSVEKMRTEGMNFNEFEALGNCHDVVIRSFRAVNFENGYDGRNDNNSNCASWNNVDESVFGYDLSGSAEDRFRRAVRTTSRSDHAQSFIITNFSRRYLGQTGNGHFSPIGGYHEEKDLVLVMDVARFKYPPFWVPLTALWSAMTVGDKDTGRSRGYFIVSIPQNSSMLSNHQSSSSEHKHALDSHLQHHNHPQLPPHQHNIECSHRPLPRPLISPDSPPSLSV